MIQFRIKLNPNKTQEKLLAEWFDICSGIWNWSIRKLELDGTDHIWHDRLQFNNILAGHSPKLGLPNSMLQGMLSRAWRHFTTCWQANKGRYGAKPQKLHLKSRSNPLKSIPFDDARGIKVIGRNRLKLPKIKSIKFHYRRIPAGSIKCAVILREPSGYYLCLMIDAPIKKLNCQNGEMVGIDPGFKDFVSLSTGEKLNGPETIETAIAKTEARIKQAERGRDWNLVRRLHEKLRNQRKLRNHCVSKQIVQRFEVIAWSADNIASIAKQRKTRNKSGQKVKRKGFGASVTRAAHAKLRTMLKYKAVVNGREFIEVNSSGSTRKCSKCFSMTGPKGLRELGVREWICSNCGVHHDRDTNAAVNTLLTGLEQAGFRSNA